MATVAVMATAFNATSDAMIPVILVVAIGFSAPVGLVNGLLVVKRNVPPFMATLAMMILLQGLRFYCTHGAPAGSLPQGFRFLGAAQVGGVPVQSQPAIKGMIIIVVAALIVRGGCRRN